MNWDKKGGKFVASYHVKEKLLSVSQFFSPVFTVNRFFFFDVSRDQWYKRGDSLAHRNYEKK